MVLKTGATRQESVAKHEYIENFDGQGRLTEILACERFRSGRLNVLVRDCLKGTERIGRFMNERGNFVLVPTSGIVIINMEYLDRQCFGFGDLETVDLPLAGTAVSGMEGVTELVAFRKIVTRFDKSGEIDLVVTQERFFSGRGHEWREDHSDGSLTIETMIDRGDPLDWGADNDRAFLISFDGRPSVHKKWACGQQEILYHGNFESIHRDGEEPAHIKVDAKGNEERSYIVDGQYHRPDGRSVVERIKAPPLLGLKQG